MKSVGTFALAGCIGIAMLAAAAGGEARPAKLKYGVWDQELPEMGRVRTGVLTVGGGTFLLMPPTEWTVELDGLDTVKFLGADRSWISIRILSESKASGQPRMEELRQAAARWLVDGKVRNEITCYTESEPGLALDVTWVDGNGEPYLARLAHVRLSGCTFEFRLLTPASVSAAGLNIFTGLLTSFQVSTPALRH